MRRSGDCKTGGIGGSTIDRGSEGGSESGGARLGVLGWLAGACHRSRQVEPGWQGTGGRAAGWCIFMALQAGGMAVNAPSPSRPAHHKGLRRHAVLLQDLHRKAILFAGRGRGCCHAAEMESIGRGA